MSSVVVDRDASVPCAKGSSAMNAGVSVNIHTVDAARNAAKNAAEQTKHDA